jgi:hypothetical protein
MPTVPRVGPYRFLIYAGDGHEPAHVHGEHDANVAKLWIDPVRLAWSRGFRRPELRGITRPVNEQAKELLEAWNDYFG